MKETWRQLKKGRVCIPAHTQSFSGSGSTYDLYWCITDNLEHSELLFHSLHFKSNQDE